MSLLLLRLFRRLNKLSTSKDSDMVVFEAVDNFGDDN